MLKRNKIGPALFAAAFALTTAGCLPSGGSSVSDDDNRPGPDPIDPGQPDPNHPGEAPPEGACGAKAYVGVDGRDLAATRQAGFLGVDRQRVKAYDVLGTEYQRMLGKTPPLYSQMATTFGSPPDRWYTEPQGSAVTLYSAYRMALVGCTGYTATDAAYGAAPDAASAKEQCTKLATKFWSRVPQEKEVEACVKVAVSDTAALAAPQLRWAHTCASILTATGFLTY